MKGVSDKQKTILLGAVIAAIMLMLCIKQFNIFDNDNYWQLAHGRLILSEGLHLTEEPLSTHEGWSFIYPQWLTVFLYTMVYDKFGLTTVNFLYRVVQIIGVAFVYKTIKLHSDNEFKNIFLTLMFFALYSNGMYSTRPFVISHTLAAAELFVLEYYIKEKKPWILAWLPVISVLWINFHNSLWIFGIILVLPMLAEWVLLKYKHIEPSFSIKPVFIAVVAYFATALINPYGIDSILYIVRSSEAVKTATFIAELQAGTINDYGLEAIAVLLAVFLGVLLQKERRIAPIRYWFLFGGTFYLAMSHIRSCTLFFICAMPLLAFYADSFLPTIRDNTYKSAARGLYAGLELFLIGFAVIGVCTYSADNDVSGLVSTGALSYFTENVDKDEIIFNTIDDGGALALAGYKVFIDDRLEVYTKELNGKVDVLKEYAALYDGSIYPEDLIEKYGFTTFYITKETCPTMYLYLEHNDEMYDKMYEDDDTVIYTLHRPDEMPASLSSYYEPNLS